MAQFNKPRPKNKRNENIAELVQLMDDLKLLSAHGYETASSIATARGLKEQRLEELKRKNGTPQEGYSRILKDVEQTRDRRHILKEYYSKVKEILQETRAISREEKDDFLTGAEECIEDLKNKRYTVLIAVCLDVVQREGPVYPALDSTDLDLKTTITPHTLEHSAHTPSAGNASVAYLVATPLSTRDLLTSFEMVIGWARQS
ncbi:hypothetical protein OS493_010415 [Desmophyllum pertusum]|uniref:Uncharacterized protein n=1 Tax=Desmophyllum pertusum TaxID=174260 RepID=A0A9X0DAI1_9CNID|nr:hypothetical protein OS493_010415 [Desmophyllum pertusum]